MKPVSTISESASEAFSDALKRANYIFKNDPNQPDAIVIDYLRIGAAVLEEHRLTFAAYNALLENVTQLDLASARLRLDSIVGLVSLDAVLADPRSFEVDQNAPDQFRAQILDTLTNWAHSEPVARQLLHPYDGLFDGYLSSMARLRVMLEEATRRADSEEERQLWRSLSDACQSSFDIVKALRELPNGRVTSLRQAAAVLELSRVAQFEQLIGRVSLDSRAELAGIATCNSRVFDALGPESEAAKWSAIRAQLRHDIVEVQAAVQQSARLLEDQKRLVSASSEYELASHYEAIAAKEFSSANKFRRATITLLATALVAAGVFVVVSLRDGQSQIGLAASRLLYEIPLLLLAIYLGRQDLTHRNRGRVAEEYSARLRTISLFAEALDAQGQHSLKLALGESILVGPPTLSNASKQEALGTEELDRLLQLVQRLRSAGAAPAAEQTPG